ncbi:MAG: UDP-3-O-(3-hydroxymyristoyl)glucosamine N-acyltransferase [bacterium]
MTVQEIAALLEGEVVGNGVLEITRVAKIEEAHSGDLTFFANPKYEKYLHSTQASAVLVSMKLDTSRYPLSGITFIRVHDPYLSFLTMLKRLTPMVDPFSQGIARSAVIDPTAKLGMNVALGECVVIEEHTTIGDNTRISSGSVIGKHARVGSDCLLYANVTLYHQCTLGDRVIVHSGTVIGSDGFGFAPQQDGSYEKIPQLGIVVVGDDVEIGANCTIDRATLGATRVEKGVKLDNMVHLGHNVHIGEHTVIAGQTGISGSTKIGKHCMIGGQVGIAGHIEIADRVVIMGQSGVTKGIKEPGTTHFGYPAKEHGKALRMEAALRSLPELMKEFQALQRAVEELKEQNEGKKS